MNTAPDKAEKATFVGKILKPLISDGYFSVQLTRNEIFATKKIARLVAQAFLPDFKKELGCHITPY
ncbi:MAG TPA: hypothetical protein VKG24_02985 [Pseudolabrys sp.]|nr:hypothetical protein [Pseudolabrys sp.]